jgi:hypothetical protein
MIAWGNTTDRILLLLAQEPMTKVEMCRRLGLTHDQISSTLTKLKRKSPKFNKRIYVCGYTRYAINNKHHIRPIYALGNKPDKPKDMECLTQRERSQRSYAKMMAFRNASVFTQTMTRRELQREKAKAVQTKANSHTYEQRAA